jgi:hypothetical protein
MVSPARNKYRAANHPYRIKLTNLTMTQVVPEPENFLMYAHNARPFNILETRVGDNTLLSGKINIVGSLISCPNLDRWASPPFLSQYNVAFCNAVLANILIRPVAILVFSEEYLSIPQINQPGKCNAYV